MPIVIVRSLRPSSPASVDTMLAVVVDQVAAALGSERGDVWAYWQEVDAVSMGGRPTAFAGHVPVVSILARAGRSADRIAAALAAAARAVSATLGVPGEDVWVHWVEIPPAQIFAGGRVLD